MSYCVNCGVELAPSEPKCPLCGVVVNNPADPWTEPRKRPYPHTLERVLSGIDRRYGVGLASMLLLIPVFVTVLTNMIVNSAITWSLYVVGAILCVFVLVLLPVAFQKPRPFLSVGLDYLVVALYVFLINLLSGGDWFLPLGLPLVTAVGAAVFFATFIFTRDSFGPLKKAGYLLIDIGLLAVAVEGILGMYFSLRWPTWSLLVLTPFIMVAAMLLFIERHKKLKDQIKRRLFY